VLTLRNPSDRAQDFSLDIGKAFELPESASRRYSAQSPWAADRAKPALALQAGQPHTFHLAPFEVLTLEAVPEKTPQR
jgi:hypothetical protein